MLGGFGYQKKKKKYKNIIYAERFIDGGRVDIFAYSRRRGLFASKNKRRPTNNIHNISFVSGPREVVTH